MGTDARVLHSVPIELGDRAYEILIGAHLLEFADAWAGLPASADAVVVSNSTVAPLYAAPLIGMLSQRHSSVSLIELADGESTKDWTHLNQIHDRMLALGCDRKTVVYALGGGVVGDLAGFAAATFMRGVPFVQVPTTLLAQVDSSVGGKTAINHARGKNMIGAFYQPQRVVCDLELLDTLPARELSAGLAEVIKYGPIADPSFLDWIEDHIDALLARDRPALAQAVLRSCQIKARVVAADEREAGLRATLNFGHTFGHAIEAGLGYGQWLHGEAVACGMVMAADLSARLGLVEAEFVDRLRRLLLRARLPVEGPALGADSYLALMRADKKAQAGEIRFVLIDGVGRCTVRAAPDDLVRAVLRERCAAAAQPALSASAVR
jgi:3-dehydroquinate synthase